MWQPAGVTKKREHEPDHDPILDMETWTIPPSVSM
jgi:hypothetical protein